MNAVLATWDRITAALASRLSEGVALLLVRVALAGIFWRSGRTKIAEGTLLTVSDGARQLFAYEYTGVPLPPELAAPLAAYAEHLFPALLVAGLFTRLSALALLGMTMVIQLFVYPEAWWQTHVVWTAMAAVLVARGGGVLSLDAALVARRGP